MAGLEHPDLETAYWWDRLKRWPEGEQQVRPPGGWLPREWVKPNPPCDSRERGNGGGDREAVMRALAAYRAHLERRGNGPQGRGAEGRKSGGLGSPHS
jgi:hypothetical protein